MSSSLGHRIFRNYPSFRGRPQASCAPIRGPWYHSFTQMIVGLLIIIGAWLSRARWPEGLT
jgi:hypothetical protein